MDEALGSTDAVKVHASRPNIPGAFLLLTFFFFVLCFAAYLRRLLDVDRDEWRYRHREPCLHFPAKKFSQRSLLRRRLRPPLLELLDFRPLDPLGLPEPEMGLLPRLPLRGLPGDLPRGEGAAGLASSACNMSHLLPFLQ